MHFFPIDGGSTDRLLCINHEYIDADSLHPNGPTVDEATGCKYLDEGLLYVARFDEEETNDQVLAVIPSTLMDENGNPDVVNPANWTELRRFFVDPNDCEVTGLAFTDNYENFSSTYSILVTGRVPTMLLLSLNQE